MEEEKNTKKKDIQDLISHIKSGAEDKADFAKFIDDLGPDVENEAQWFGFAMFSLMMLTFHREEYTKIYGEKFLNEIEVKFQRIAKWKRGEEENAKKEAILDLLSQVEDKFDENVLKDFGLKLVVEDAQSVKDYAIFSTMVLTYQRDPCEVGYDEEYLEKLSILLAKVTKNRR